MGKQRTLEVGRQPVRERTRLPDDAPPYAVGHPVKLEALIALHEGDFTAGEVAELLGEDLKRVTNHLHSRITPGALK